VEFVAPITREERLWEGAADTEPVGTNPVGEFAGWLEKREGRPVALLGAPFEQAPAHDEGLGEQLRRQLNRLRRAKDELELERMRFVERATAAGFARFVELIEPGRTERQLQIELEAEFFRHGADDRERDELPRLRIDLPLLPGYVTTIEPGIYFVPALVRDPDLRRKHGQSVNWERAEAMLGFGGVRIEHDVLVTADGYEVLTADVPV